MKSREIEGIGVGCVWGERGRECVCMGWRDGEKESVGVWQGVSVLQALGFRFWGL